MRFRKSWLTVSDRLRYVKMRKANGPVRGRMGLKMALLTVTVTNALCLLSAVRHAAFAEPWPQKALRSKRVHRCRAAVIRNCMARAAMLATGVSMPPFRGGHACPGTLELKIVGNRVRRDVAGRAVDAAAVAGRRSAEIEPLDWRACSR